MNNEPIPPKSEQNPKPTQELEPKQGKALARRLEREFQPHMAGEYMLNSVLRDYLRNNLPPDFTNRILDRLSARKAGHPDPGHQSSHQPPEFTSHNLDEALGAALADINFGPTTTSLDENHASLGKNLEKKVYQAPEVIRVEPRFWHYRGVRLGLASAAVAASLLGGWLYFNFDHASELSFPLARKTQSPPSSPSNSLATSPESDLAISPSTSLANSAANTTSTSNPAPPAAIGTPATVNSQSRPLATATNGANAAVSQELAASPSFPALTTSNSARTNASLAAEAIFVKPQSLPQADLTMVINSQLTMAWEKAKFPKRKLVDDSVWLSRVSQIAIGREPTTAEQESLRADKSTARLVNVADKLVSSSEFSMHWSRLLTEYYLDKSIPSIKSQPANIQQFANWIKDALQNSIPISSLEAELSFPKQIAGDQTPNLWFNETINRELLSAKDRERSSKLSYKYDPVDAPIVNLTSSMLHRSGFTSASCVQCHAPGSESLAFVASTPSISSKQFWSMSAYMMEAAAKSGSHVSSQSNQLFYEEDNGRVTVAVPKLLVDNAGTPTTIDLKDWVTHNSAARNGIVELIWKQVFYQPLVPEFGLSLDEAFEERNDLKTLLAGQLQSSGNLQRFVSTMLLSDALKSTDAAVSASWYLRAQDEVLSAYHQRTRLFAFVPTPARSPQAIRSSRNNELATWIRGAQLVQTHAQLAQPASKTTAVNAPNTIQSPFLQEPAPKLPELEPSQLLYALSLSKPYTKASEFATRVSGANLGWNDQVHHAYWLVNGRMATHSDLANADAILKLNNQNTSRSLIEILVGISGSY